MQSYNIQIFFDQVAPGDELWDLNDNPKREKWFSANQTSLATTKAVLHPKKVSTVVCLV